MIYTSKWNGMALNENQIEAGMFFGGVSRSGEGLWRQIMFLLYLLYLI